MTVSSSKPFFLVLNTVGCLLFLFMCILIFLFSRISCSGVVFFKTVVYDPLVGLEISLEGIPSYSFLNFDLGKNLSLSKFLSGYLF